LHPATALASSDVPGLVRAVVGLQAQEAPAARLSLRARSSPAAGLTDAAVEAERAEARRLVRTWAMRGTLHLLAAEDAAWLLPLLGPRFVRATRKRRADLGLDEAASQRAVVVIRRALADLGPQTRAELRAHLQRHQLAHAGQALIHAIYQAAFEGVCVYGPDRDGDETFALLDDWAPAARPAPLDETRAWGELARRYLAAFGPAAPEDLAAWAGVTLGEARLGFEQARTALAEVPFGAQRLYLLKRDAALLAAPRPRAPIVRLLPRFDTYLLGYRSRDLVVDPPYHKRVLPGGGMLLQTLLVNGRVAGTWQTRRARQGQTLAVSPFEPLPPAVRRALAAEAEAIGSFLSAVVSLGD
jgi:hypothetical protein